VLFKVYFWQDESVIYNIKSGDIHLLSSFDGKVLDLMSSNTKQEVLIKKIIEAYQIDYQDAEDYLGKLYDIYRKLSLID